MPIPFTCPHCGAFTEVADEYAEQTGPCAACRKPVTVPRLTTIADVKPKRSQVLWNWFMFVLGSILIASIGVGLFTLVFLAAFRPDAVPLIGNTAPPPPECKNNLRRIGEALQAYAKDKGHYPPAFVADETGKPKHSWRVLILPYLGEDRLYAAYDMNQSWDSENNLQVGKRMPSVYRCAYDPNAADQETSYMVINGPTLLFNGSESRKPSEITDAPGATIMVVEVANMGAHWMEPVDLDGRSMDWSTNLLESGMGSHHPAGGLHVLMADGSVFHFGDMIPADELQALATLHGGEAVDPSAWSE